MIISTHSNYSKLCFSRCITLCFSNELNLLAATSNVTSVLLNILPGTIKPLLYAQPFVLKTLHIFSPISTSLSYEITIEIPLTSKKHHLAKFCKVDA